MKRRSFIGASAVGAVALSAATIQPATAGSRGKKGVLLVHGSWHGAWCWGGVIPHLHEAGIATFAIDLPGHGLNTILPDSFTKRPLDGGAFATEVSPLAGYGINDYADAVIKAAEEAKEAGVKKLYAVGHSMGGVPISFAAAKRPDLFEGLVYIAALAPVPGKPAGAYLALPDQAENSKLGPAIKADPATIGALRIDPRSEDESYLAAMKLALAEDVDDAYLRTVMHYLTPDAPVSIYGEVADFASGFEKLERSFIICNQDKTVLPSTAEAIIADMDAAWPKQRTKVRRIDSSHEAMFAAPEELARHIKKSL